MPCATYILDLAALLALVLERPPAQSATPRARLHTLVHHMEVLSVGLAGDARIASVRIEVRGDVFPELAEHEDAASEVQCGERGVYDGLSTTSGGGPGTNLKLMRRDRHRSGRSRTAPRRHHCRAFLRCLSIVAAMTVYH